MAYQALYRQWRPERFADILRGVGFKDIKLRSQSFGIAYIYEATK